MISSHKKLKIVSYTCLNQLHLYILTIYLLSIQVLFMAAVLLLLAKLSDSNENIPFVPGDTICDKCSCAGPSQGPNNPITIDCTARGFSNVLSNWPLEFDYGQGEYHYY